MTAFYRYRSGPGITPTWGVDLGNDAVRFGGIPGFVESAEQGQTAHSEVVIDDPDADVGHTGDAILGHQIFELDESAMAAGNIRVYMGLTAERTYQHREGSSLIIGSSREILLSLVDLNALLSMREFLQSDLTAKRPVETASARLAWVLGHELLTGLVADNGLVAASSDAMAKTDYRGQRPVNVISDCALQAGYNFFVYPDETKATAPSLFFDDFNASTAYTSTLRISNVEADRSATTLPPAKGAKTRLVRSPENTGSRMSMRFAKGVVNVHRAATEDTYPARDLPGQSSNIKGRAKATTVAERIVFEHRNEEDRILTAVDLPPSQVNLIRAGHRISVKFSHLPGYTSFTWMRVVKRSVGVPLETDQVYTVDLELTPQEDAQPAAVCPDATVSGTFYPLGGAGNTPNASDGVIFYWRAGISYPTSPPTGLTGRWHFPAYSAGGAGSTDYMGDCAQNRLLVCVVGNGTVELKTEMFGGTPRGVALWYQGAIVDTGGAGDTLSYTITDTSAGDCFRVVEMRDSTWPVCGSKVGFSQVDWTAA